MDIGILTAPFRKESFEQVLSFAADNGFAAMEVNCMAGGQIDPAAVDADKGDAINALLEKHPCVRISALAAYGNMLDPNEGKRAETVARVKCAIRAAKILGVDVVCALAGMPLPGKNKMQTIEQDAAPLFKELSEYAGERGIKLALENWFATNIQHLGHWRRLFELVPADNFGLNFDPSHLCWQQIDYIEAVREFAPRIFHTHAKDCEIRRALRSVIGVLEMGWWRYVIPGFGEIDWGRYISALRDVKYDGVLSIEHEDRAFGREDGFLKAKANLARFV